MVVTEREPLETAFYYPDPFWVDVESGWVKGLLLFFDDIALFPHAGVRRLGPDRSLAEPLEDLGLLRFVSPDWFMPSAHVDHLADLLRQWYELCTGVPDNHAVDAFAQSLAELGYPADIEMVAFMMDVAQGFIEDDARTSDVANVAETPARIRASRAVRTEYIGGMAQSARAVAASHGLDLHPVSSHPLAASGVNAVARQAAGQSKAPVVLLDAEAILFDVQDVPLDEVLDFREAHRSELRNYRSDLRSFVLEVSLLEDEDRTRALKTRRAELDERADAIRHRVRRAWSSPKSLAGCGLGAAGAAWSLAAGNPVPAVIALAGAALQMVPAKTTADAFTYLFAVEKQFRTR